MDSGQSGARPAWSGGHLEPCGIPWDEASGVPQRGVYPGVGGVLAVVKALGVDAEQDFDAVSRSLGDAWRGDSGGQPQGHGRVPQIVGATGQGRDDLSGGQGQSPRLSPDVADGGGGDRVATVAAEDPAVRGDAEGVDAGLEGHEPLARAYGPRRCWPT
jgi:hypothetical protein